MIKRINVSPQWRGEELLAVLAKGESKQLPLNDDFVTDKGWVTFWGDAGVERGLLTLKATPDTTGGAVFLDGSFLWDDYHFEVDLAAHQGESLSLLGRFRDSANFVTCTFEDGRISVAERLGDVESVLATVQATTSLNAGGRLGMHVQGTTVDCLLDGNPVLHSDSMSPTLNHGGVGIKNWSPVAGKAHSTVRTIRIREGV